MTYNGWKNRATWNVALWVSNDEGLYRTAESYARRCHNAEHRITWHGFCDYAGLRDERTPDGFKYYSASLDMGALTDLLKEMAE